MENFELAKTLFYEGLAYLKLEKYEQAEVKLTESLKLVPDRVSTLTNLSATLIKLNKLNAAKELSLKAIALDDSSPQSWINRGLIEKEESNQTEAIKCFDKAIHLDSNCAEAWCNKGAILNELKHREEALVCHEQALKLKPDYPEACNNRGVTLQELNRWEEALTSYARAIHIKPDYAEAYSNRGNLLIYAGRPEDAIRDFEHLLTIRPAGTEYSRGTLLHSRMQCCDWRAQDEDAQGLIDDVRAGKKATTPFFLLGISDSMEDQLSCSRVWVKDKFPGLGAGPWKGKHYSHDRIRVAYLSSDLHDHPVAYLMAGLFEQHDRARFETTAISFGSDEHGEMRTRLKGAFERFIDVRHKTDLEVAELMRELEIDIAVDLNGHTLHSRTGILALRPAPVQVNYLGYPGTLGADFIDYIFADRFVIPEAHRSGYAEQVVYLPDTYQANDNRRRIAERVLTRAEAGLPANGMVYCVFNRGYKITPIQFDVWMRVLRRVEGSVIWFVHDNTAIESNLRREAARRGVASERLVFAPRMTYAAHLARYGLADLFLDTLPFNAGTTASDALWAGLPVLTCPGESFVARMAGSLLHAIGLPELIVPTLDDYEALAVKLATEPDMLTTLKAKLARNRATHPLFDTNRFRRHIEAAYTTMWKRAQRGDPPASFAVQPTL